MTDYVTFNDLKPIPWDITKGSIDMLSYPEVEFQITGITSAYTLQRSMDNIHWSNWYVFNYAGNQLSSISSDGIYLTDGSSYLRLVGGSGATVAVRGGF